MAATADQEVMGALAVAEARLTATAALAVVAGPVVHRMAPLEATVVIQTAQQAVAFHMVVTEVLAVTAVLVVTEVLVTEA